MQMIASKVDDFFGGKPVEKSIEELLKQIMTDPYASNYFLIRNAHSLQSTLLHLNIQNEAILEKLVAHLSNITRSTTGMKTASTITGLAAAHHMGEEIAEGFGSD